MSCNQRRCELICCSGSSQADPNSNEEKLLKELYACPPVGVCFKRTTELLEEESGSRIASSPALMPWNRGSGGGDPVRSEANWPAIAHFGCRQGKSPVRVIVPSERRTNSQPGVLLSWDSLYRSLNT